MRKHLKKPWLIFFVLIFLFLGIGSLWLNRSPIQSKQAIETHQTKKQFIASLAPEVQPLAKAYGVQPSVLLAQIALETDFGKSLLMQRYQNALGLLARAGDKKVKLQEKRYVSGQWREKQLSFSVYNTWSESVYDYLSRLKKGDEWGVPLYHVLATTKSYKEAAKSLQSADFSSDPEYADKLVEIITTYKLTTYDK